MKNTSHSKRTVYLILTGKHDKDNDRCQSYKTFLSHNQTTENYTAYLAFLGWYDMGINS